MYILEKIAKTFFQFDEHSKHTDPSISTNPKWKKSTEKNHINAYLIKLLKVSDKEEKKAIITEQQRMTDLSETMQARRHRGTVLKVLTKKVNLQVLEENE